MAKAAILETVANQLEANDPPEVRETYERLLAEGQPDKEARRLIACALTAEMFDIMQSRQPYNNDRYVSRLRQLPNVDFLDE